MFETMWEFILGFLLGVYFWKCWSHPRTRCDDDDDNNDDDDVMMMMMMTRAVLPGLQSDITLPHEEELELHHNMFSSCSQKVRACLGETGLKHR